MCVYIWGLISPNILILWSIDIAVLQYYSTAQPNTEFPISQPKKTPNYISIPTNQPSNMSPISSILLKNGTLLIHSADGVVKPSICDLLIRGNVIERIAKDISAEPETVVIDCTDKIVSPGFIDTHRHMWHTQMKGYADSMLLEYITEGRFFSGVCWGGY